MIILNDVLIDEDIFLEKFVCDLSKCHGCCCVEGDYGAPVDPKELSKMERCFQAASQYMTPENIEPGPRGQGSRRRPLHRAGP